MKKKIFSFVISFLLIFSIPFNSFATSSLYYIYNHGQTPTVNLGTYYSTSGTNNNALIISFLTDSIYISCNDNLTDWCYCATIGTSSAVSFDTYNTLVVEFSGVYISGDCRSYLGYADSRNSNIATMNSAQHVEDNSTGNYILTMDISDVSTSKYVDFGFLSYHSGAEYNSQRGTCSGYINDVYLTTDTESVVIDNYYNSSSGGSGGSGSVDLTPTNNFLSDISDTLEYVSDDVTDIKSALTNSTTGIAAKLDSLITSNSTINTTLGTINTSLGSKLDTININITGLRTDLTSGVSTLNTSLGNIVSAVNAVPTGINTRLDSIITYLGYINQDLTNTTNGLNSITAFNTLGNINSNISGFRNDFSDFVNTWAEALSAIFVVDDEPNLFVNLDNLLSPKFTALQNVILYGDSEGSADDIEEEEMKLNQFSDDLDNISSNLDDAPDFIDSQSGNVSSQISLFTQFYNGITGLNVGITSILYFGLIVILIKKVVGR